MKARRTWPFSQLVPRRLRSSYCTQCLCCLAYADDPPFEPRMATLSSATRALNSASQPPSADNGRRTKGSLSSLPRTSFRFENLCAVYLTVERSLVLTFDLSSIFCRALASTANTADLLFLGPSQIHAALSVVSREFSSFYVKNRYILCNIYLYNLLFI